MFVSFVSSVVLHNIQERNKNFRVFRVICSYLLKRQIPMSCPSLLHSSLTFICTPCWWL